jgi:8-oxo-dGTP diphosphatase
MGKGAAFPVSVGADEKDATGRLYPSSPRIGVSIAVFRDDRVLLATRTKPPFAGAFSLPGGLVELGETLEEAALRELREEVDVEARITGFNRHVEAIVRDENDAIRHHYVIASFIGEWVKGEGRTGPEAGAILWANFEDIPRLVTTPQIPAVLENARKLRAAKTL